MRQGSLGLVTFDGDVTLYDDGQSLMPDNPVIPKILRLLSEGTKVGIVTAAGYTEASRYHGRLYGLLQAVKTAVDTRQLVDPDLIVLGGESNYLFTFDASEKYHLKHVPRDQWMLHDMLQWTDRDCHALLDVAEEALRECISSMNLQANILRKERAVGIVPRTGPEAKKFTREQLEETVLLVQQIVEMSPVGKRLPFCAFNGKLTSSNLQTSLIYCL